MSAAAPTAAHRLLVTGGTGFVGRWVLRRWAMEHPGVELWSASDRDDVPPEAHPQRCLRLDLRDAAAVRECVQRSLPTHVIHLAGLIGAAPLADHLAVNVVGTANLYDALADLAPDARVVQVSTAAVYGPVTERDLPMREDLPLRPITPYALSKAAQEHLAAAAALTRDLHVVIARCFNLLGPGQPESIVPMTFIRQLREVAEGRGDRLQVGNTASRRDFVDIRDVAAALDALLEHGESGAAYNVASGTDVSIQEIIDAIVRLAALDVPVERTEQRVRRWDVPRVRADVGRLHALGWRPTITLEQSLRDMWGPPR